MVLLASKPFSVMWIKSFQVFQVICFLGVMAAVDRVGTTVQIDVDFRIAQAVAKSNSEATPGC